MKLTPLTQSDLFIIKKMAGRLGHFLSYEIRREFKFTKIIGKEAIILRRQPGRKRSGNKM